MGRYGGQLNDSGVIVANIDLNLEKANELYSDIKKIFDNAGVKDFMSLPINKADCKKFQLVFRELSQVINGMKLQGMKWKDNKDEYVKKLDVCQKWVDDETRIFDVLYMRYKDLFQARNKAYYNRSQSNRILEINKLKDTCDIEKVIREFGGNKLTAKGKLLAKIKEFVGIS